MRRPLDPEFDRDRVLSKGVMVWVIVIVEDMLCIGVVSFFLCCSCCDERFELVVESVDGEPTTYVCMV